MEERLQKYLAKCGIASRRKCEELIMEGRISVNGTIVGSMGVKIVPGKDTVRYDGKIVHKSDKSVYIMLNKPVGYITTTKEQFNRPKVTDLVNIKGCRLYPVGRLDYDSSGLLLMTNDGDLTFKMTHPGHEVDKKYIVEVEGIPDETSLGLLRNGIELDGYITSPAKVKLLNIKNGRAGLEIIIHEGKNRQVRRMCSYIGHEVISLKRISIGGLNLGDLEEGQWRYLNREEISYLIKI